MMKYYYLLLSLFLLNTTAQAQVETEIAPPFHIKTVSFVQSGQNAIPVFSLTDVFQFQFDDLYGNEANYYYQIVHCNYDWTKSDLSQSEYIMGFDDQRIQDYTNSFNTLQLYSHYKLTFPNKFTQFRVTGNYMLKILNDNKEIVFSRKFILYQDVVSVPMQIKRARNISVIEQKQNLDFAIKSKDLLFQSPLQNVKVLLFQNGEINSGITNIKPQYTIGNDLIYKYDSETQFWGGNEYLYFENKDIRAATNNVLRVDSGDIYNAHLYTNAARANNPIPISPI